jgi:hypothetical protein
MKLVDRMTRTAVDSGDRRGQARVLALVLSHRPSELTLGEIASEVGEEVAIDRAVAGLVDVGLVCTLDDSVLATPAAVRFNRLEPLVAVA